MKWLAVNRAQRQGSRGLPGSSSVANVRAQHRSVRNVGDLRPLTIRQVLKGPTSPIRKLAAGPQKFATLKRFPVQAAKPGSV